MDIGGIHSHCGSGQWSNSLSQVTSCDSPTFIPLFLSPSVVPDFGD